MTSEKGGADSSLALPHLRWRLLTSGDEEELDRLLDQLAQLDTSVLAGLSADSETGASLLADGLAIGGWDAYDTLTAYGALHLGSTEPLRLYLFGGVLPAHRHKGIGTALLAWQVAAGTQWRDEHHPGTLLLLSCHAELGRQGLMRAAQANGFTVERYYYDLVRGLEKPPPPREVPGVAIVPLDAARSEEVRALHNECFKPFGGGEVTAEEWAGRMGSPEFREDWSHVALADGAVVGYAINVEDIGEHGAPAGWTERFGVHPAYRGRGIALALLSHGLHAMSEAGCEEAGIGVDTPDGLAMSRLVADLGYVTRDAVGLLTKVVA
ncbi:MAG: GNAT family N-acetyltransferase [Arachnia sp.]